MTYQIHDVEQNSDAWKALRAGRPTASAFQTVLSPKAGADGAGRMKYMRVLAGEIIRGAPSEESFKSNAMDRGHQMEDRIAKHYAFLENVEIERVGFVTNGRAGASPDRLVGKDGGLECKSQAPELLIETFEKNVFPSKHVAQVQGNLWICEREWWAIAIGYEGMPTFIKKVYRDTVYILKLKSAVAQFCEELDAMVERIRTYGPTLGEG